MATTQGTGSVNPPIIVCGVDITDPTRNFTQDEMQRLGCQGQAIMFQQRQMRRMQQDINSPRSHGGGARGQIGRGGRGRGRYIAAVSAETDVSAMTNPTVNEGNGNTQGRAGAAFGRGRGRGRQGG